MDEHGIDWEEFVPPADTDVRISYNRPVRVVRCLYGRVQEFN